jgi:hypothetical protein
VCDPEAFLDLIGALADDLDVGHRLAGLHDRADDRLHRRRQRWHAVADRAPEMPLDRNPADLGEPLIDLQIAAIRREKCETDRRGVIDQLQRWLLRKLHTLDERRPHILSLWQSA